VSLQVVLEHDPNGVYAGIGRAAMLTHMVNLRQLGARALLYGEDGEDVGVCHLPLPVEAGDLAAVDGAIFRIVGTVDGIPLGHAIDALVVVRPVRLPVASH
jgi:hypothetical protein